MKRLSIAALAALVLVPAACRNQQPIIRRLQAENAQLRRQLAQKPQTITESPQLQEVPAFTVGLSAAEGEIDAATFEDLLNSSLQQSGDGGNVEVNQENDPVAIEKMRGILMQQYLAGAEIPVVLGNLTFPLQNADASFKIGGQLVPRDGLEVERTASGEVVATHPGPLTAALLRDSNGQYSLPYEELGGRSGSVVIRTSDAEILDSQQRPRAERQGDITFNWNLDLNEIRVFRVRGFRGDMGAFLAEMRYSGIASAVGRYQTLQDVLLLFGYESYETGLISQLRTESYVDKVEVLQLTQGDYNRLTRRLSQQDTERIATKNSEWVPCRFTDFSGTKKIWERPFDIQFPFLTRQYSESRGKVFYVKFSAEGPVFLADYDL